MDKTTQLFVKLDSYESEALIKLETAIRNWSKGRKKLSRPEILRMAFRDFVHTVLPSDFMLGKGLKRTLEDNGVMNALWDQFTTDDSLGA